MQNPNEDTQWNDILRSKGILPPKEKEITEEEIANLVQSTIDEKINGKKQLEDMTVDELDELEDEEDEYVLMKYRQKRIAEIKALALSARYGNVIEISGCDYVEQVNEAGSGVWVVLHLYLQKFTLCNLINQYLSELALKFPATKFLKSIVPTCIPNYPEEHMPSIFIYYEGKMQKQFVGHAAFPRNMTMNDLEWMLGEAGAVTTDLMDNPRPKLVDGLFSQLQFT